VADAQRKANWQLDEFDVENGHKWRVDLA